MEMGMKIRIFIIWPEIYMAAFAYIGKTHYLAVDHIIKPAWAKINDVFVIF